MARKQREPKAKSEWVDPDDAPELTEERFRKAHIYHGEKLIHRGEGPTREELAERDRRKDRKD